MTHYEPGAVVLVHFPFTDLGSVKRRPAVVVSPSGYSGVHGDLVLLALTSQHQPDDLLKLDRWQAAGLPKPTWLKPVIGTLSRQLVERRLGAVAPLDRPRVAAAIKAAIAREFLP